jgi:hypothetical protein
MSHGGGTYSFAKSSQRRSLPAWRYFGRISAAEAGRPGRGYFFNGDPGIEPTRNPSVVASGSDAHEFVFRHVGAQRAVAIAKVVFEFLVIPTGQGAADDDGFPECVPNL